MTQQTAMAIPKSPNPFKKFKFSLSQLNTDKFIYHKKDQLESKDRKDFFIVDVVDCHKRYGICYKTSRGQIGAAFNDKSHVLLSRNEKQIVYKPFNQKFKNWEILNSKDANFYIQKKFRLMKKFKQLLQVRDEIKTTKCLQQGQRNFLSLDPINLQPFHAQTIDIYPEFIIASLSNKTIQVILNTREWSSFIFFENGTQCKHLRLQNHQIKQSQSFQHLSSSHPMANIYEKIVLEIERYV